MSLLLVITAHNRERLAISDLFGPFVVFIFPGACKEVAGEPLDFDFPSSICQSKSATKLFDVTIPHKTSYSCPGDGLVHTGRLANLPDTHLLARIPQTADNRLVRRRQL